MDVKHFVGPNTQSTWLIKDIVRVWKERHHVGLPEWVHTAVELLGLLSACGGSFFPELFPPLFPVDPLAVVN